MHWLHHIGVFLIPKRCWPSVPLPDQAGAWTCIEGPVSKRLAS